MGKAKGRETTTRAESLLEALYAVIEGVEGLINHQLNFVGPNNEVRFKDSTCASLSSIRMTDFISNNWTKKIVDCSDSISSIDMPESVKNARRVDEFLDHSFRIDLPGALHTEYGPNILTLTRDTAYYLAGNFKKHSIFKLNKCATKLQDLLKIHGVEMPIYKLIMEIDEISDTLEGFYEFKAQHISEVITNLYYSIFNELDSEFNHAYRSFGHAELGYNYVPSFEITSDYERALYWALMNKVRRKPILPLVEATDFQRNHF